MYAVALETLHFNAFLHLFESRRELFDEVHLMNDKESWKKVESSTVFQRMCPAIQEILQ